MSPRKLLVLTALVVVLFGFILLFERKMPSTSERKEKEDLVWEVPQDRIESLTLEHGGVTVELRSAGEKSVGWKMTKPETYPADAGVAGDVASQLARLRRAGNETPEARPEDYGFKAPSAKATITWKEEGNDKKRLSRTLEFGIDIPGTDTTAARVAGTEQVFFVSASLAAAIKKKPDEFKSKEVFGGSSGDAVRLEMDRGRGRLILSKKDAIWWIAQPLSDLADGEAISRLVGDLTGLRLLEFLPAAERQNLAPLGLAPPLYRVTLSDAKGGSATVDFGATRSDGNSVYAQRESQVFTVPSSITEELSKEAVAFREPRLIRFDRARVTNLSGLFGQASFALAQKEGGWSAGGKPVSANLVDDLLSAIGEVKSRAFLDDTDAAALKAHEPNATVTVKSSAEEWTVRLYAFRGQTRSAVSGRPGAFELASDPTPALQTAFQKATAPAPPTPAPKPTPKKKP